MNKRFGNFRIFGWVVGLVLLFGLNVMLTLNAADKKNRGKSEPPPKFIFYPPAPAIPRLQFLISFSSEADFGSTQSKFARFIVGKEPPKRNIIKPYGLALAKGKLYVCDTSLHGIEILDLAQWKFNYFR